MSGNLSTKDVKTGGDFTPKNIEPGNVKAKMFQIELDQPDFLKKDDAYFVVLHLETEKPNPEFVGFHKVFGDESSPTFDGQTAKVKASRWSYRDTTTNKGIEISRDQEIMKFLKNICEATGCLDWWNKMDNKIPTIEQFVEKFNEDKPFEGVFVNWCIGGRQYDKPNGYKGWDLHLPKFSKAGIPFESLNAVNPRVLKFDPVDHTEIAEAKPVDEFGGDDGDEEGLPPMADSPEFEL